MENFLYNVGVDWLACLEKPDRPAKKGRKGEQMKVKSRFLALLLAMVMALGLMIPAAASEEAAPADNSGKIVILHTNDVHCGIDQTTKDDAITGIGYALDGPPGVRHTDDVSRLVGGGNWQSRREAYAAYYAVFSAPP